MTNHVLSNAELTALAADLINGVDEGQAALMHRAGQAILSLMKQIDAQSNYFTARMMKANQDLERAHVALAATPVAKQLRQRLTAAGFPIPDILKDE